MAKTARQKAKDTAWRNFSKYIRLRDCLRTTGTHDHGLCISCGARVHFNKSDAGHFVGGRSDAVLFEECNCHIQCIKCNRFLQGKWVEYEEALIELYGPEEVQRLKSLKHQVVIYKEHDYREISDKYRKMYNELKNESC